MQKWESRAVLRDIEPGSDTDCPHCGERVKFQAKVKGKQVICNVYKAGKWVRVEHYHLDCYSAAQEPFGPPEHRPSAREIGRMKAVRAARHAAVA